VRGTPERRLEIATTPIPRGAKQPRLRLEHLPRGIEITVRHLDETLHLLAWQRAGPSGRGRSLLGQGRPPGGDRCETSTQYSNNETTTSDCNHHVHSFEEVETAASMAAAFGSTKERSRTLSKR
jgi:hypothetical protein